MLQCVLLVEETGGFVTCRWLSPGPQVSSTNKTERHDITEILLKVALNSINHKPTYLT